MAHIAGTEPENYTLWQRMQVVLIDLLMLSEVPSWLSSTPQDPQLLAISDWQSVREEQIDLLADVLDCRRGSWVTTACAVQDALLDLERDGCAPSLALKLRDWCGTAETAVKEERWPIRQPERPTFTCPQCERRFHPNRKDQVYCSDACKQAAWRERKAA